MQNITLKSGNKLGFNYAELGDVLEFLGVLGNYAGKYLPNIKLDITNIDELFKGIVSQGVAVAVPIFLEMIGNKSTLDVVNKLFRYNTFNDEVLSMATFERVENRGDLIECCKIVIGNNLKVFTAHLRSGSLEQA